MKAIYFVTQKQEDTARQLERSLLRLGNVLFAGCRVVSGESPAYDVLVGCPRTADEDGFQEMILGYIAREFPALSVTITARRGIADWIEGG